MTHPPNSLQLILGFGTSVLLASACSMEPPVYDTEPGAFKGQDGTGKSDAWAPQDSPFIFAPDIETSYQALPKAGSAKKTPWASSYWPYYEDSINHLWDGDDSKSAAKKFEDAFGLSGVEDGVSAEHGVDSQTHRTACTTANEDEVCDDDKGEACAIRHGEDSGHCIPTWFGICPAWAASAILLPEPEKAVDFGGEHFKINDIKALVTVAHERVGSKFVSLRCNLNKDDIELDADGRPTDRTCRFTNAGTFHLLLSNFLGIRQESFIEDRTFDAEVWNQPIRGFEIDEEREVSVAEANELIGVQPENLTKLDEDGSVAKDEWSHFGPFVVSPGSSVNVAMRGNGDADLHVRFGAQPNDQDFDCRPFGSNSVESCNLTASDSDSELFVSVKGFASTSDFEIDIEHGDVASTYKFNANAASLRYIKNTVSWITESASTEDGNLSSVIDSFTHTDTYEYILEIDADGKVIGGEWVGDSKLDHPDFLWLPTGLSENARVASGKIRWGDVKTIYELSVSDNGDDELTSTWNGNGSLISLTSDTDTGFGLDRDLSRVHPESASAPVVFFQWEIDGRDGRRLRIEGGETATITYGGWGDRSADRVFEKVSLPFVIDPAKDGKSVADGQYYVVSVQYADKPGATTDVKATVTTESASSTPSTAASAGITVDGHSWNGNASVISHSSGSKTGFGLNYDVANIHPTSEKSPVVFYQWEVSGEDGRTLEISAEGMSEATITYGTWSSRASDVTRTVSLPHVIDPSADGKTANDGDWYVVKVAFPSKPATKTSVWAKTPNANP